MPTLESSSAPLHWIVPFAASLSEPCEHALPRLAEQAMALPHLRRLLAELTQQTRLEGDEYALSMPHERVLAAELGWPQAADGELPWAAWWAARDGLPLTPGHTWGLLSPGHWLMGHDHLTLIDPATLGLSDTASRALFEAIRPLFESEGWSLHWGSATRWYASHASLAGLPTASLDRVIHRNPDLWLTDHVQARTIRRLQAEVQMMLYQHPMNDERDAQGLHSVNSFWLSGCGQVPEGLNCALPVGTTLVEDLRSPLLSDDMALWLDAWAHVDAGALQAACQALDQGREVKLTLCGERHALTLGRGAPAGLGARLLQTFKKLTHGTSGPSPQAVLASL